MFFFVITLFILWQMLLPGYVLTMDMVFTPETKILLSNINYGNSLPLGYLIHFGSVLFPTWVIQKIILFILFFSLGYFSYKFLPLSKNKTVRFFSSLVYIANPFVYSRFLAGQWTHLIAYAILPIFIHLLFKFTKLPSLKTGFKLFFTVFIINIFSLHFFVMVVMIMFAWFLYYFINYLINNKFDLFKKTFINLIFTSLSFLVIGSYWLIPAFNNPTPVEQRFDIKHWQAFSATGHNQISTTLNILSLNGFWGEGGPWSKQFAWPQDYAIFWLAIGLIWALIIIGVINGFKNKKIRPKIIFFVIFGIFSFILSTGAGETIFKGFNIWLFEHIFFWSGFRDSQKFVGLLALSYVVLSGYGVNAVISFLKKKKKLSTNFSAVIFLIPISLGFLIWGGFKNQVRSVWYPDIWFKAREVILSDSSDYKVLFLPWHGYLSLNFNNNLLVANPAKGFFGEKSIVSRSVEIKDIYDQEVDLEYKDLDKVVREGASFTVDQTIDFFIDKNIKYIVFFQDLNGVDNLKYEFLTSSKLETKISDELLILYEIKKN